MNVALGGCGSTYITDFSANVYNPANLFINVMGNLSLGSTNRAFNSTKLVSSLGIEVTPLTFIPLRAEPKVQPNSQPTSALVWL